MADEKIRSFRDLVVWQKSKEFAVMLYRGTGEFPREEMYGLISQLRRASVSIVSNIAEGFNRSSPKEKLQFLRMAYGSGAEIEAQLEIAKDLSYLSHVTYEELTGKLSEIMRILNVLTNKI